MTYGQIINRTHTFFKKDIFTALVALSVLFLVSGVPMTALAAEKADAKSSQAEQLITTVNINKADAALLAASLKGVGMKKAAAIVEWRNKNGNFKTVEQLSEVKGIASATIEKNRGRIVL